VSVLPSVSDVAAWSVPAEVDEVATVVEFLITACDEKPTDARTGMLARLVRMRGYSRAELLLAAQTVPFDPRSGTNYGRGLNAADLERVIDESRTIRAMLDRMLTERQMFDICGKYPQDLRPDMFGICGYDATDRPFYRYARSGGPQVHAPRPQLEERTERVPDGPMDPRFAAILKRMGISADATGEAEA
jgi:hypothetical protein